MVRNDVSKGISRLINKKSTIRYIECLKSMDLALRIPFCRRKRIEARVRSNIKNPNGMPGYSSPNPEACGFIRVSALPKIFFGNIIVVVREHDEGRAVPCLYIYVSEIWRGL